MFNIFRRKPKTIIIGQEFGLPMTREEVHAALGNAQDQPLYRAFGQMLMALREQSVTASDQASVTGNASLAAYQHGSGNACIALVQILQSLSHGKMSDDVKEWFKESDKQA